MAGSVDDAGTTGHIQDLSVDELVELSDRRRSGDPLGQIPQHVAGVPRAPQKPGDSPIAEVLFATQIRVTAITEGDYRLSLEPVAIRLGRTIYEFSLASLVDLTGEGLLPDLGVGVDEMQSDYLAGNRVLRRVRFMAQELGFDAASVTNPGLAFQPTVWDAGGDQPEAAPRRDVSRTRARNAISVTLRRP